MWRIYHLVDYLHSGMYSGGGWRSVLGAAVQARREARTQNTDREMLYERWIMKVATRQSEWYMVERERESLFILVEQRRAETEPSPS